MTHPETPPTSREEAVQRIMMMARALEGAGANVADAYDGEPESVGSAESEYHAARATLESAIRELAAQPVPNGASITNDFIEHSHRDYGAVYFCTSDVLDRIRQLEAAAAQPAVGAAQPEPATYSREWFIAAAERAGEFVRANPVLAAADAKAAVGVPADPLQGAADWLREALNEPTVADIQSRLLIGYNRAKRLFDAPPSPAVGVVLASEREQFEVWLTENRYDKSKSEGQYCAVFTRNAWHAWQARATHPSAPDPWRQAIDEALVAGGLDCLGPDEAPAAAVNRLISWEVTTALDPAISERAQALIERGRVSAPPAGYALVPLEPTKAMNRAGFDAHRATGLTGEIWRAMVAAALSAAPSSQQPKTGGAQA